MPLVMKKGPRPKSRPKDTLNILPLKEDMHK